MKKFTYIIVAMFLSFSGTAQEEIDSVLNFVAKNNKTILAYKQLMIAKKTSFKTGLTLANPTVEYDYMQGSPVSAGNQTDISAVQSFDFPTTYIRKKQLSRLNIQKLTVAEKDFVQEILLETKLQYIELIYLNQHKVQLLKRKENALQIEQDIELKFESGAVSALALNKAKINLITVNKYVLENERKIASTEQKLSELCGGSQFSSQSVFYPLDNELDSLQVILKEAVQGDFHLQVIQQDELISQKQVQVSKSLSLPKLEGGYRYQAILGQSFNGIHAGISIPLFENKNKVKAKRQQVEYFNLLAESHKNEHHNELEALYERALSLKNNIADFQELFGTLNSNSLLSMAYKNGEMSSIEYFMELNYYYHANDDLLALERDYNLVVSELMKYKL